MSPELLSPIAISLKTAVTATVITFGLGTGLAWWMNCYLGKGKSLIETILTAPLVLPPTVVGFLLLLSLGNNGWLGQWLKAVGIRVVFTWYATVIAAIVVALPLMYKSAHSAFAAVDSDLIDCARTLGAAENTIFWRIILPLAKQGLIAGALLSFARALGEFGATLMLAGSIPGKTQTIPIAIYLAAENGEMDRALGLVIVLLAISLFVLLGINYGDHFTPSLINSRDRGSQAVRNNLTQGSCYLEVNIQKQLPNFLLDIAFKIEQKTNPLGILGISGSGKTTLLRCIAGLETPDQGKIILNQRILFDSAQGINLSPQERRVGLVWQDCALFPHLRVGENIAFGMPSKNSHRAIAREVKRQLKQLELSGFKRRYPDRLSGGEKQRVALARAFASQPQITLLDEPCSALDNNLKARLLNLLQQRLANYSGFSLYVTHNLTEAYSLCSQILIIDCGKAISFSSKSEIFNRPPNLATAQLVGCQNISPVKILSPNLVRATAWDCELQVESVIPEQSAYIGIHAHQLRFIDADRGVNIFSCWLTDSQILTDRVRLYLKLHSTPQHSQDYHLSVEVTLIEWQRLEPLTAPWYLQLEPKQIMLLKSK
ncbi:MAG: molybdate ABC transporter permease subunit [Cyanobacteria bacterium J06600_6]